MLSQKGVALLQCGEDFAVKKPEKVTEFITRNKLQRLLIICDSTRASVTEAFQYSTNKAGLGRLAVSYLDAKFLGKRNGTGNDAGTVVVSTNLARLERADLLEHAISRTVLGAKVSRRELLRSVPHVLKVESDIPIIFQNLCNHRSGSCRYCKDACPVNAISLTQANALIDERLCIECGACARECPTGAIQGPSVSDDQILAMLSALAKEDAGLHKRVFLLSCPAGLGKLAAEIGEHRDLDQCIVPAAIPCVGTIGSIHYIAAAFLGVNVVTVCPDISCEKAESAIRLYRHAASAKNLLMRLAENKLGSVNHLSLNANESMVNCVSRTIESSIPLDKKATIQEGSRREVLLEAVRGLSSSETDMMIRLPPDHTFPLFDIQVEPDKCTYCELCQKTCPDHAIEFVKGEGFTSLTFDPSACGGCMLCERDCPPHAIHLSRLVELSPILEKKKEEKARDEIAKCERCGTPMGTKGSLAAVKRKLSEQGAPQILLTALNLCSRCKAQAVFFPLDKTPVLTQDVIA
jgi:ferredoxin